MPESRIELSLEWNDASSTPPGELETRSLRLRDELQGISVDSVAFAERGLPANAKSGIGLDICQLIITLVASTGLIAKLVDLLEDWLNRNQAATLVLKVKGNKIEIRGANSDETKELLRSWMTDSSPQGDA